MKEDNAILTPAQAAEELSLNLETVRSLMRRGILPAAKVGGSWRTTRRALYGYLENQMGLESRFHAQRREDNGRRLLQVQRRCATVDKRRKGKPEEPEEIFFPR
ncbi:MAG: helix-turn-helix domain-containing protein [Deltaproteobacteria bacterium]|nr:helix-turn-helix domain-containing protein [Deltaproteobacteria bacterium]MBW2026585.1 helix-turn-helix domain-containing protein [Deltaproteobacteria bacterium]